MSFMVVSVAGEGPIVGAREKLRAGRKAFLRCDWSSAKGCFLEVLGGAASTEEEKRVAQRYLKEIYLMEGRDLMARRRENRKLQKDDKVQTNKEDLRDSGQTPIGRPQNRFSLWWKKSFFLVL